MRHPDNVASIEQRLTKFLDLKRKGNAYDMFRNLMNFE